MQVRLTNIALPVEAPETELPAQIARQLNVTVDDIRSWRVLRKSLDARQRRRLQFVYSVSAEVPQLESLKKEISNKVVASQEEQRENTTAQVQKTQEV